MPVGMLLLAFPTVLHTHTLLNPQSINEVSTVLRMIRREVPCAGRAVLTNVQVGLEGLDQGNRFSN